jgi:proteic killer suppression protein
MIKGFRHKGLKQFFETGSKKGIQADHVRRLSLQVSALDEAEVVDDMDQPGWKLHALKGELDGHWSVKVSGNWRMTFIFTDGDAHVVNYQDYH